jgi:hypothetical protein
LGEPSLWQKFKGERPSYRTATVWKLVSYDDARAHADVASRTAPSTHTPSDIVEANKPASGETSPPQKG